MRHSLNTYDDPDEGLAVHLVWAFIVVQIVAIVAAVCLPFGFDKRSSLGLDFEHLMLVAGVYTLACILGCAFAAALRKWMLLLVQIGGALMALLVLYLISIGLIGDENVTPAPVEVQKYHAPLDSKKSPADRQEVRHAIGEAERELAEPPSP